MSIITTNDEGTTTRNRAKSRTKPKAKRKPGRPCRMDLRPNVLRRVYDGREYFEANVRGANKVRTYLRRYATREEALAVCEHFIATGEKPQPSAGRHNMDPVFPRKNYKPRARKVITQAPAPVRRPGVVMDRVAMMRMVLRRLG